MKAAKGRRLPAIDWATMKVEKEIPAADSVPAADFTLTERSGREFHSRGSAGSVWVASFFFSSCPGPCLRLNQTLASLQEEPAAGWRAVRQHDLRSAKRHARRAARVRQQVQRRPQAAGCFSPAIWRRSTKSARRVSRCSPRSAAHRRGDRARSAIAHPRAVSHDRRIRRPQHATAAAETAGGGEGGQEIVNWDRRPGK